MLINAGAGNDVSDPFGLTPLDYARANRADKCARLLHTGLSVTPLYIALSVMLINIHISYAYITHTLRFS